VEDEQELISYLHERGLTPGTRVRLAYAPTSELPTEPITLLVSDQSVTVEPRVAHALWVVAPR
jgi:hypothetical protein